MSSVRTRSTQPLHVVSPDGTSLSTPTLDAGENHVGEVSVNLVGLSVVPTVSNGAAYTAGDIIGGPQTITNAFRISSGSLALKSVSIIDTGNQKADLDLLFFNAATTNVQADNAAYAWQSADFPKFIGRVNFPAASYTTIASEAVGTLLLTNDLVMTANATTNLYMIITTTGTPTYTGTNDLRITLGVQRS